MVATYYNKKQRNVAKKKHSKTITIFLKNKKSGKASMLINDIEIFSKKMNLMKKKKIKSIYMVRNNIKVFLEKKR